MSPFRPAQYVTFDDLPQLSPWKLKQLLADKEVMASVVKQIDRQERQRHAQQAVVPYGTPVWAHKPWGQYQAFIQTALDFYGTARASGLAPSTQDGIDGEAGWVLIDDWTYELYQVQMGDSAAYFFIMVRRYFAMTHDGICTVMSPDGQHMTLTQQNAGWIYHCQPEEIRAAAARLYEAAGIRDVVWPPRPYQR